MSNLNSLTRLFSLVTFVSACGFAQANFLVNSSFEVNTSVGSGSGANDTADGWSNFAGTSAQSTPDMWDNSGSFGLLPGTSGFFSGVTANHGTKFATIGSFPAQNWTEGIESSSFGLVSLQLYQVNAHLLYDQFGAGSFNNPSAITVRLRQGNSSSTVVVGTLGANNAPNTWQNRSLSFSVATSDSYTLIFSNENIQLNTYIAIDNMALEAVPEPMTLSSIAVGIAGLLASRKRQRA